MVDIEGMIIHDVQNHGNSGFVQALHHLFELTDATGRVVGIGRISALWHIIVHRVISPVVLWLRKTGLVNRTIVITWQDMNSINAKVSQMLNSPWFCQCKILAWILRFAASHREITMVHLIDHQIGRRLDNRTPFVPLLTARECLKNGATLTIHAHSLSKNTRCFSLAHVKGIETPCQVTFHCHLP